MSLETYREAAFRRAVDRTPDRINNDSRAHANILVEAMVANATEDETIYIYSGSLPRETFSCLLLTSAQKVLILVDDIKDDFAWLQAIKSKIQMFHLQKPRPNHFLCTSGGYFRFETDARNFEAEASFSDEKTVATLIAAFERYQADSVALPL